MEYILYGISLLFLGIIIGWFFSSLRMQKKYSDLETKAKFLEAIAEDKGRIVNEKEISIGRLRDELSSERQIRIEIQTRMEEAQRHFKEELARFETLRHEMTETFKALSFDALRSNTVEFKRYADEFIKLAEEKLKTQAVEGKRELEGKKELIDRHVEAIGKTLNDVEKRIEEIGKISSERFTEVATLIKRHEEVTARLRETTEHIGQALASSKKRGEWGERMAEDIVRLVGMVEGINYVRQKTMEKAQRRPDYTFFLPNNMKINMDVKFPLDNYLSYLKADTEHEKRHFKEELIKNTRLMIKQVTTREYINTSENTVDYVLIFIPNEQVYGFIQESGPFLMDEALKQKVILCSPFTLYAVLAVIRQAMENFNLERTASEILKLLSEFSKQWTMFKEKFKMMGEKIDAAKNEYDILVTTRSNMLERSLKKIDELGRQKALGVVVENFQEDK